MRAKALLLAAQPPIEGPWVPIADAEKWLVEIHARPGVDLNGELSFEVMDDEGSVSQLKGGHLSGSYARVLCGRVVGLQSLSVYIEEIRSAEP